MTAAETTILYRPVGKPELDLIAAAGYRRFPPRLSWQPIFYPVLSEDYAMQIACNWNTTDARNGSAGFVTRIAVDSAYLRRFPVQCAGGPTHLEL